jgi:predicted DCC family thiol-disulfide oxidoreductase YuxK
VILLRRNIERIVLYDGVCNLCDSSVNFIIRHDAEAKFLFAPMQEPAGKALLEQYGLRDIDLSTFVLIEDGKPYFRSAAWMRIVRQLDGAWPIMSAFTIVPPFIRDAAYDFIGSNRYKWFGKKDHCMVPTPDIKARFVEWRSAPN